MARFTGNKCKLCRREGMKLFLKGQRCFTDKCALARRDYPPGVHAQKRTKVTEYGVRLREKQKLKRIYGVLERQFKLYFREAERLRGNTGENLLMLLERRLDNVVLSSGFALSRNHARQLINHGHFRVNGRKVTISSFQVRPGDALEPAPRDATKKIVAEAVEVNKSQPVPTWLEVNGEAMTSKITGVPRREDVPHPIQEQLIIELCSK
ncbi:MAG: 30S ribosomal protein S4 [Planctomycetes bacterium]|jgi:small subunit ribosomal protein S4|nr:30S ribosomal protein S4 [Planctomycetota bacterium]MDP6408632.1 30S ribosomal protein S4 [Planctomycetota bacterium]